MRPRAWVALAAGLIVVGPVLLIAPIDLGSVSSRNLGSGEWLDLPVPRGSSWAGTTVEVRLSWGTLVEPCRPSPNCFQPNRTLYSFLAVFDCGPQACQPGVVYPFVGATGNRTGGNSGFNATPGHHYQVWAWYTTLFPGGAPIPVRYALVTPILDGGFGVGLVALGTMAGVLGGARWRQNRRSPMRDV